MSFFMAASMQENGGLLKVYVEQKNTLVKIKKKMEFLIWAYLA